MKIKNKYKKICLLLLVLVISCFAFSSVNAAITVGDGQVGIEDDNWLTSALEGIADVLGYIGGMAASGVFSTVTSLINILSIAMFLILEMVFVMGTGEMNHLPLPDTLVFNKIPIFDPNFIRPSNDSLVDQFGSVLNNLFASFHTIAIAVFIIAAMITGLKMALSTIASKKAQYKQAALKWVSGFLILICLKWILAGIFYINEILVATLYGISKSESISIPIYITEAVPIFGRLFTDLFKLIEDWTGWDLAMRVPGYLGIILSNLTKSMGGDVIASIVGFVLMGQTLTIVGSYLKRVFGCILLGMISPLIVAVDTINASTGKQSTVFANWLKNFTVTVFTQSIHALYMVVTLQILSDLYSGHMKPALVSIVTIMLTTGLVKMEKMLKGMFGMGDGFMGDLKDGSKGMMKAFGAIKGAGAAVKSLSDNAPKMKEAAKRKQAYTKELNTLKSQKSPSQAANDRYKDAMSAARDAKHRGDTAEYTKQMKLAMEARREAVLGNKNNQKEGADGSGANNGNNNNSNKGGGDYLQQVINAQNNPANLTREQKIQKLEEGIANETKNYKSAALASIMGPANLAAGVGFGLGMGEDFGESLFKGGYITAALDWGTEKIGGRMADKDRKTFYEAEKKDGDKYGYTPSEKIVREKTIVEKNLGNPQLYINPIAVGKEIGKQLSGIGEVLSDTMKKELREMDRDLDNQ